MEYSVRNRRRLRSTGDYSSAVPRTATLPGGSHTAAPVVPAALEASAPVPRTRMAKGTGPVTSYGAMPESPAPVTLARESSPRILPPSEQAALAMPRTATARGTGMNKTPAAAQDRREPKLEIREIIAPGAVKDSWKR